MATIKTTDRAPECLPNRATQRRAPGTAPGHPAAKFAAVLTCLAAAANFSTTSGNAHPQPAGETVGSKHVFKADAASPYPAIGCWDHRALMYVVREMGDDAQAAQLFADRECRKLVPDAAYLKCGTGGFVHPLDSAPLPYSGYCRLGVQEIKLYVLDRHMPPAPAPSTQAP